MTARKERLRTPLVVTLKAGQSACFCVCGRSDSAECSGACPAESGLEFASEKEQIVMLCRCGLSEAKPFCDGSHNRLQEVTRAELVTSFFAEPFQALGKLLKRKKP